MNEKLETKDTIDLTDESITKALTGDKSIFVSWSGGLDSTLILIKILKRKKKLKSKSKIVAISCCNPLCGNYKILREVEARKNLKEYISKNIGDFEYMNLYTSISNDPKNIEDVYKADIDITRKNAFNIETDRGYGISQFPIWITSILPIITKNSVFVMGYIKGDDLIQYIDKAGNIFKSLMSMIDMTNYDNIIFSIPMASTTKEQILYEYYERYYNLYKLCTWCEKDEENDDEIELKCNCIPCTHHREALYKMSIDYDLYTPITMKDIKERNKEK